MVFGHCLCLITQYQCFKLHSTSAILSFVGPAAKNRLKLPSKMRSANCLAANRLLVNDIIGKIKVNVDLYSASS